MRLAETCSGIAFKGRFQNYYSLHVAKLLSRGQVGAVPFDFSSERRTPRLACSRLVRLSASFACYERSSYEGWFCLRRRASY
eukprot:1571580-Pleurochrysis_carterae.AAC.3